MHTASTGASMSADCFNCSRVVADDLPICPLCMDVFIRELKAVPGIVSDMTITRARLDRMTVGRHGGKSAETALPIRLDKFGKRPTQRPLDQITNEIGTWARDVATLTGEDLDAALASKGLRQLVHNHRHRNRQDPAALSMEAALDVELAAIWLTHYPDHIRMHPEIMEMFDGITDAIAGARKVIDRQPQLTYKGTCPHKMLDDELQPYECGADLYVEKGEEYVSCPWCWTHHDVRKLDKGMLERIDDQRFTLAELFPLLRELGDPVPKSTLYAWANDRKRRKLDPKGWKQADGTISDYWMRRPDPPVYRLGDVRDLIKKSKEGIAS